MKFEKEENGDRIKVIDDYSNHIGWTREGSTYWTPIYPIYQMNNTLPLIGEDGVNNSDPEIIDWLKQEKKE